MSEKGYSATRFDAENILALDKCRLGATEGSGFTDDDVSALTWEVPYGSVEECKTWLRANRLYYTDGFSTDFRKHEGPWRVVKITSVPVTPKGSDRVSHVNLTVVYAKGYYTEIDWAVSRLVGQKQSNVASGKDTNLMVVFPFCDPDSASAMLASLNANTYTDPEVDGVTYTGTFNHVFSATKTEQDGSVTITIFLADDTYSITTFSDLGGVNEADIIYVWRVAKQNAPSIISGWKTSYPLGSSATASYGEDQTLVDLVLRKRNNIKPNLSIRGINFHCDTVVSMHFAWGYAKGDIQAFIDDHNSSDNMAGMTRRVNVDTRGDGFYDITIIEEKIEFDEEKHLFDIATFSGVNDSLDGASVTFRQAYGWNVPLSEFEHIKELYESPLVNQRSEFRVTRKDNCLFDFIALIEEREEQGFDLEIKQEDTEDPENEEGIGIRVEGKNYAETLPGTEEAPLTSGRRERKSLDVEKNDFGSYRYRIITQKVAQRSGSTEDLNPHRIIFFGSNVDELPDIIPEGGADGDRVLVGGTISVSDDGALTYNLIVKDLDNPVAATVYSGDIGTRIIDEYVEDGKVDDIPFHLEANDPSGVAGERHQVQVRLDPETGSASWLHKETVPLPYASEEIEFFNDGIVKKTVQFYFNEKNEPTLTHTGCRESVVQPQQNDFGYYDYAIKRVYIVLAGNPPSLVIESQNDGTYWIDPIKSALTGWEINNGVLELVGSPAFYLWERRLYQTVNIVVTRKFYLVPTAPTNPGTTVTFSGTGGKTVSKRNAGYDSEREVWFVDEAVFTYSAITNENPYVKVTAHPGLS